MSLTIVVGAQWGDEGKGGITDILADSVDIVARYSGGDNAGHTVTVGDEIFKLHLIPSGILRPNTICLLGSGVVINPKTMLREMAQLRQRSIDVSADRLKISYNAHLITPAHVALDKAAESARGLDKIGTTQRGIGPAYSDKSARSGLRAGLLRSGEEIADAVHAHITDKNRILQRIYDAEPLDATAIATDYARYARELADHLCDGPALLHAALASGKQILGEGAQGTLLDLDHGTYPFVTSSSPLASGALLGLGLGPKAAERIIGVAKAFSSRVGSGPFVTELDGRMAARLRGTGDQPWDEFGTTTGRPRRVGWLDCVALRYAARLSSFTELALTKLDILSGLETIPVCVAYEYQGKRISHFPSDAMILDACAPIYETLPGWEQDIMGCRDYDELPANARSYVDFVSEQVGAPIRTISIGPAREQTIMR